ncbi:hypothetical protein [Psychrobacter aquimaris]|uniref:hypothetical protein n=1 Tax=Psychrobacter aquimaris TaxID=292733 RepID=UPI0039C5C022|tara:strand:+ start:3179 stop:5473 length:2295 start_codon:yes stop_codon:yes gene_type:complete
MLSVDKDKLKKTLDKLVPTNSPASLKIQNLIDYTVSLKPDLALNINFIRESLEMIFTDNECDDIADKIVKAKKIEEWAVSYMLILFYRRYGAVSSRSSAWQFMSVYLQIILRITMREDKHFAKVNQLGVRVRMGLNAHNPQSEILNELIHIHNQQDTLAGIIDGIRQYEAITKQSEASGEVINKKLAGKIGRIRLAYEVVAEDKQFVGKTYSKTSNNEVFKSNLDKFYYDSDDEPLRATAFGIKHENDNVSYDENLADDDSETLLDNDFKPSKHTAKSSELQQWKLKNNYRHARRNGFGFPTILRQLSLASIQMLFNRLWQLLMISSGGSRSSYTVILIALISGRRVQDVIYELGLDKGQRTWLSYNKGSSGSYHSLNITVNVTTNRRSHLLPHKQSFDREFTLPIPIELQSIIEQPTFIEHTQISESLKDLQRQLDLPALSYQHIESALYSIIKNELNEPLHADLITAVDVKHSSSLYYTSISTESLNDTYFRAISLMSKMCGTDVQKQLFSKNLPITNKPHIGSDMALNRGVCQKFFEQLADAVESFNERLIRDLSIKQDRYIEQFNTYSIWLWHIIMIQTGIRPVVHAPGLLNQFDFRARLFWVSDKEERQGQSQGRLIPLSQFLITAIQNYIKYIKQFAALHNVIYPSVKFPIEDILNSRQPLIQLFSKNPRGFSGITPSKVRYQLKSFFSHQDNWLRHQLRTLLTNRAPEHLIRALYGHEQPDQEAMHPMSSLSINKIKSLNDYLDEVACELNLKQVEV